MKSSNIGGQAVLEGIMMKNRDRYAVAVRKPDGEIFVQTEEFHSVTGRYKKLTTIPFIRGVFNFIDSMVLGIKTLTFSASFYEEEDVGGPTGLGLSKFHSSLNLGQHAARSELALLRIDKGFRRSPAIFPVITDETGCSVLSFADSDRRLCKNRNLYHLYFTDLEDERYPENIYVSRCGAQVHQLH